MIKATNSLDLIPHRAPMLLIEKVEQISQFASQASVNISRQSPFFSMGRGVPAWIGIEYMGQTAALIAGYQLVQGLVGPHLGFLLGTRKYKANTAWFCEGSQLLISCDEFAVVGSTLATFDCRIQDVGNNAELASARLSVFRKALT